MIIIHHHQLSSPAITISIIFARNIIIFLNFIMNIHPPHVKSKRVLHHDQNQHVQKKQHHENNDQEWSHSITDDDGDGDDDDDATRLALNTGTAWRCCALISIWYRNSLLWGHSWSLFSWCFSWSLFHDLLLVMIITYGYKWYGVI